MPRADPEHEYECDCGRTFQTAEALREHERETHGAQV
jgi:hypothetical protein